MDQFTAGIDLSVHLIKTIVTQCIRNQGICQGIDADLRINKTHKNAIIPLWLSDEIQ